MSGLTPNAADASRDAWRRAADSALLGCRDEARRPVRYAGRVSPTVLRIRGYRFYFFSREELRAHIHVQHAEGEAKFWLEPTVEVEGNYGLKPRHLAEALKSGRGTRRCIPQGLVEALPPLR